MTDVLTRIVARKRSEVKARKRDIPSPPPTHRSLRAALARPGARFIMEAKQRSPSGHVALHPVEAAVRAFAPVADAISILTDGADFGGSIDDLEQSRALFDGPILAKDFVVDPFQVREARAAGADAVLAMMSVLDDNAATAVIADARALGMDVLVEVHDETELDRALALGAELVGINNRDLKTLTTDFAVTERLAPRVPANVLLVSESGIESHRDVGRLSRQVDAFLVGSSLTRAPDIAVAARALVHGHVKLCGLTTRADVALAAAAGATHAGFIFVPGTPRAIDPDHAALLVRQAKASGMRAVGVFRDAAEADVVRTASSVSVDAIQLHGAEDEGTIDRLRAALAGVEIIATRAVEGGSMARPRRGDRPLFDTALNGISGGTGQRFDWQLVKGEAHLDQAFVAGGIDPFNAAEAAALGSYGLDICSGVESAPGVKDAAKVGAVFDALRPKSRGDA